MAGLTVNEVTRIEVSDSEGNAMRQGDTIVLRIDTEDILCVFEGIKSGYFITKTCDDGIGEPVPRKEHQEIQSGKSSSIPGYRE